VSVERLAPGVRELVRAEIAAAHGREVSFVARPDANGLIVEARVVARGTVDAVLALPGIAGRGEIFIHNHPSGVLEPSGAMRAVSTRIGPVYEPRQAAHMVPSAPAASCGIE